MRRAGSESPQGSSGLDSATTVDLFWLHNRTRGDAVAVNLSIKNVPDQLAASLRARAARNHRSIQGELMAILEEALGSDRRLGARKLLSKVRKLQLTTDDEATRLIRIDRDGH